MSAALAANAHDSTLRAEIDSYRKHAVARMEVWRSLGSEYRENLASVDAEVLADAWSKACGRWWLARLRGQGAVRRQLRIYRKINGKPPTSAAIPLFLEMLSTLNAEDRVLHNKRPKLELVLGEHLSNSQPDWLVVKRQTEWTAQLTAAVERLAGSDAGTLTKVREKLAPCLVGGPALVGADGQLDTA